MFAESGDVDLNAIEVKIGAVGIRDAEETVEAVEIVVYLWDDVLLEETGGAGSEIIRAGVGKAGEGKSRIGFDGFLEFKIKDGKFIHVIGGGHLAEEISGAQCETDGALNFRVKRNRVKRDIDAGAANHALDGLDVTPGKAFISEEDVCEIAASVDVVGRVFRACAGGVIRMFQVTRVMEQDGHDAELKHALRENRCGSGADPPPKQTCETESALQGVLEIVV